jgi:hypothetical protein
MRQAIEQDHSQRRAARATIASSLAHLSGDRSDFIVVYHRDEERLIDVEVAELRRWVRSWRSDMRPALVVVGCCADTAREDRKRRLADIIEQLLDCGVPRAFIRYTDQWVAPPSQSNGRRLPEDVVWLKAVDIEVGRRIADAQALLHA